MSRRYGACTEEPRAIDANAQEDDGRMANDYMALDERIGRLEETVAKEFFGVNGRLGGLENRMGRLEDRMGGLEDRMDALNSKNRRGR